MTQPVFGFQFNLVDDSPLLQAYSDFSILGIVLPVHDANQTMFPLNTPVDINTGDPAVLAAAGTQDLYFTLTAINNQLVGQQLSARAVVVLVPTGGNTAETTANIIGNPGASTGIYALLLAPSLIGITPRILIMPGYTGEFTYYGGTVSVGEAADRVGGNVGGGACNLSSPAYITGYQPGTYVVTCVGGATSPNAAPKAGGNTGNGTIASLASNASTPLGTWRIICNYHATGGGSFQVFQPNGTFDGLAVVGTHYTDTLGLGFTIAASGTDFVVGDEFDLTVSEAVPTNGGVFSVTDPFGTAMPEATVGTLYADEISFTLSYSTPQYQIGDSFGITVSVVGGEILANPLCAALPAVCEALMAHAIVDGPGTDKTDAINWQTTLQSMRIIPVDDPVIVENYAGNGIQFGPQSAFVAGIAVAVDFSHQGYPFWAWANQPIQGILGVKRVDTFSLLDGATDGQELLADGIGIVVPGDHSDTSLTDSGWSHISWMNASPDPYWTFYNKSRGRDFIHLALLKNIRFYLGRENITPHDIQAVINEMNAVAMDLLSLDCLIGFTVGFNPAVNSPDNLRQGAFRVYFNAEEPAPILLVTIDSGLDYTALVDEIATLATIGTESGQIGLA